MNKLEKLSKEELIKLLTQKSKESEKFIQIFREAINKFGELPGVIPDEEGAFCETERKKKDEEEEKHIKKLEAMNKSRKFEWLKGLKKVKILGKTYKIEWHRRKSLSDKVLLLGDTNGLVQRIRIVSLLWPETAFETFLHEIIHAYSMELQMRLTEQMVYLLGSGLSQFFLDNFELRPKRK